METTTPAIDIDRREDPSLRHWRLKADIEAGLRAPAPYVPTRLLYAGAGGDRFRAVVADPHAAVRDAETSLLGRHASAIAELAFPRHIIEVGGGASTKLHPVIRASAVGLRSITAFDVDEVGARASMEAVTQDAGVRGRLQLVVGDFERDLDPLPRGDARLVALLGSTYGNLSATRRASLLAAITTNADPDDSLLLGLDLDTDGDRQVAAYSRPSVRAFCHGVLENLADVLGSPVPLDAFRHVARWDAATSSVVMELVAGRLASIPLPSGGAIDLAPGDAIRTATSAKFDVGTIERELSAAGYERSNWWLDSGLRTGLVLARRD